MIEQYIRTIRQVDTRHDRIVKKNTLQVLYCVSLNAVDKRLFTKMLYCVINQLNDNGKTLHGHYAILEWVSDTPNFKYKKIAPHLSDKCTQIASHLMINQDVRIKNKVFFFSSRLCAVKSKQIIKIQMTQISKLVTHYFYFQI